MWEDFLFYFCFRFFLLVYISLICTILYVNFCIHYWVLTIKSWVSICCHAVDPLYSSHPPLFYFWFHQSMKVRFLLFQAITTSNPHYHFLSFFLLLMPYVHWQLSDLIPLNSKSITQMSMTYLTTVTVKMIAVATIK